MSNIIPDYMEEYIKNLAPKSDAALQELEAYAEENNVPIIQKEVAAFLQLMVSIIKPKKILELGTAIGYSAAVMSKGAEGNAHITTIERNEVMINKATENILKLGLCDKIEIMPGDCLEVLEKLQEKYDLIFMDAGKGHYNHFLPHCLRLLNEDGIIIADNVLYKGMVASRELLVRRKITIVKRMKTYLDMVCHNDELMTSVIPLGDGIAITKRRKP
jgi:predicted O-methyltransferase YrrM